jgi:hypothetical protein
MTLFKKKADSFKKFKKGDLVYDLYYGSGIIVDTDERFGELEVRFREELTWLTPPTVESLQLVSRYDAG